MVDAINGTSGIKPKDLTIDWYGCTATEVMEYKDEGQEIPAAILSWAQDMAKSDGADNITYEMAMENPNAATTGNTENLSAGSALRQELEDNGATPVEQASAFANASTTHTNMIENLENEMDTILQQSEAATASVQDYSNNLLSQIQTLRARQEKAQADKTSMYSAIESINLENQIKQLANFGLTQIDNQAKDIYSMTNGIDDALQTALDGNDIGKNSIEIGTKVIEDYAYMMSTEFQIGMSAIKSGNTAISKAQEGKKTFNETKDDNTQYEDIANASKNSVRTAAGTFGTVTTPNTENDTQNNPENETATNNPPTEQNTTQTNNATTNPPQTKTNEENITDDTNFTTDPDEIRKRKERNKLT